MRTAAAKCSSLVRLHPDECVFVLLIGPNYSLSVFWDHVWRANFSTKQRKTEKLCGAPGHKPHREEKKKKKNVVARESEVT